MTREEIVLRVNEVFEEEFEQERDQLTADANIFTDLGLDSLDTVDLIVALHSIELMLKFPSPKGYPDFCSLKLFHI